MGRASWAHFSTGLVFVGGRSRRWRLVRMGVRVTPPVASVIKARAARHA